MAGTTLAGTQADAMSRLVDGANLLSRSEEADCGYGFGEEKDGMLFLVSMEERDWYISTTGYGITALTDAGLEYMSEKFLGSLPLRFKSGKRTEK